MVSNSPVHRAAAAMSPRAPASLLLPSDTAPCSKSPELHGDQVPGVCACHRKKKELAWGEEQRLPQAWSSYKSQVRPCSRASR